MIAATAIVCVAVFALAIPALGVPRAGASAMATARAVMAALAQATDDAARERAARGASIKLFSICATFAGRAIGVIALALLPLVLADRAGIASASDVVSFLSRWDVLLVVTAVMGGLYVATRSAWRST